MLIQCLRRCPNINSTFDKRFPFARSRSRPFPSGSMVWLSSAETLAGLCPNAGQVSAMLAQRGDSADQRRCLLDRDQYFFLSCHFGHYCRTELK